MTRARIYLRTCRVACDCRKDILVQFLRLVWPAQRQVVEHQICSFSFAAFHIHLVACNKTAQTLRLKRSRNGTTLDTIGRSINSSR